MSHGFASLRNTTWELLEAFGPKAMPLPEELGRAVSHHGKTHLHAEQWELGGVPGTTCRWVYITGVATEILNAMFYPARGGPVFVAEFLATANVPRLAFIDLQTPGLNAGQAENVEAALKAAPRLLPAAEDNPPDWASKHSTGKYLWSRPGSVEASAAFDGCKTAYAFYLNAWKTLVEMPANPEAHTAYRQFKLANWPGRDYMDKMFGEAWTARFATEFLYA
jgi:hypothetical protein